MRLFAIATVEPNNDGKVIVNTCFDCTEYSRLLLTAMSVVARVDFTIALAGKSPSIQTVCTPISTGSCNVTRSVSKMTEIERRGGKRWDKPKKAEKSRDCGGGKF